MIRVRVFVDHSNVKSAWQARFGDRAKIAWSRLPDVLLGGLKSLPAFKDCELDLRGVNVYASCHPHPSEAQRREEEWLRFDLDTLPAFTVKVIPRQLQKNGKKTGDDPYVEKGVDVKLACDMLSGAFKGAYDVAVLITEDADFAPAIECVQELDRQVVHVWFGGRGKHDRAAAWSHLLLDDFVKQLRADSAKPKAAPPKGANDDLSTAGAAAASEGEPEPGVA